MGPGSTLPPGGKPVARAIAQPGRPCFAGLGLALALALCVGLACGRPGAEKVPAAPESPIRFFREHVTVEATEGRARVIGVYDFRNDSDEPAEVTIRYPFPVDRYHLYPSRIDVAESARGVTRPLGFVRADPDILWRMSFGPREERRVVVEYVQEIREPRAVYIVTTTRGWGRPIELAEFEFRVPSSLTGVTLSETPDSVEARGDTVVYRLRRESFMPDADLSIRWEAPRGH